MIKLLIAASLGWLGVGEYVEVSSGECSTDGYVAIATDAECQAAMEAKGYVGVGKIYSSINNAVFPPGCSSDGTYTYFNVGSRTSCGFIRLSCLCVDPSADDGGIELSYGSGCNSNNREDEALLFDGDDNTYCESDGVHSDAILIHMQETQRISGVKVTMTGYTGTVWFRARSNDGRAPATNYGSYLGCIGGEYWDRPDQRGGDVEIQITTGKQTWEFDLGEAKDIDCLGIAMSPYAGNPRGVYSPRPRLYEIELITPPMHTCVCENGAKADDSTCAADGESNCESCDDGYALDGKECAKTYGCDLYESKKFCSTDYCTWSKGQGCRNKDGQSGLTSEQFCGAIKPKRVCESYENCFFWFDGPKTCISKVKMTQKDICAKTRGKKNCKGPDCAFNTATKKCMLPSENSCELYTKKAHCAKNPCVNNKSCTWYKGNCESGGAC